MIFRKTLALQGPNTWAATAALEVWVDLTGQRAVTQEELVALIGRLSVWLPELASPEFVGPLAGHATNGAVHSTNGHATNRHASHGEPVAPPAHDDRLGVMAQTLACTCLALQRRISMPAAWTPRCEAQGADVYRIAVAYEEEAVGRACLDAARRLGLAAWRGEEIDLPKLLEECRTVSDRICLGPSTRAIVQAAQARGIPVRRLNQGSFVQLGHGAQQRRVRTAETDRTGAVAEEIASDKQLTKQLLRAVGVPVPEGRIVESAADAWAAAEEIGVPVVVKPRDGNHGRGVFTALMQREQVEAAYEHANQEGDGVLVERFALGAEHRLLVVDGQLVAATRGDPAVVVGDGTSTISQLIETQINSDPRRGDADDCPLAVVAVDSVARLLLSQRGYTADSIPPWGDRVVIQYNGNLAIDVTDEVHPEVVARVVDAARVVGLDVAGLDVVVQDIGQPLEPQRGVIVEVNAGPGLQMHLSPSVGKPRPVGEAIVGSLFREHQTGRIPLVAVLGSRLERHAAHAVAHVLGAGSETTGLACGDGMYVGSRRLAAAPQGERQVADLLLANPSVESAVIGVTPSGILETGLAVDRCDLAIITDSLSADDGSLRAARILIDSLTAAGTLLLNADDKPLIKSRRSPNRSVLLFSVDHRHPLLLAHRARGERVVFVRHQMIFAAQDSTELFLASLTRLPRQRLADAEVAEATLLAAAAAGWVSQRSPRLIRAGLESFASACGTRLASPLVMPTTPATIGESESALSEKDPQAA